MRGTSCLSKKGRGEKSNCLSQVKIWLIKQLLERKFAFERHQLFQVRREKGKVMARRRRKFGRLDSCRRKNVGGTSFLRKKGKGKK